MAGLAESDKIKRGAVGGGQKETTFHVKVASFKTMAAWDIGFPPNLVLSSWIYISPANRHFVFAFAEEIGLVFVDQAYQRETKKQNN